MSQNLAFSASALYIFTSISINIHPRWMKISTLIDKIILIWIVPKLRLYLHALYSYGRKTNEELPLPLKLHLRGDMGVKSKIS